MQFSLSDFCRKRISPAVESEVARISHQEARDQVQHIENGVLVGPTLVLKDLWLPEGAKTELEIQQGIKDNINKVHIVEGLDPADFEKHFVAIKHCEIVKAPSMTKALEFVEDNSTNFLRGKVLPGEKNFCLKLSTSDYERPPLHVSGPQISTPQGSLFSEHRAQTREMLRLTREHYGNKAHHRILMEDAGKPLEDIRDLRIVLLCIGQATTGLSIMFSAGVVHRDISTGNLLISEVNGELKCKITDLEYAKKVGASSQVPQDAKTGTPFFMALEIESGYYLFKPLPPTKENPQHKSSFRSVIADLNSKRHASTSAATDHVRYNFLHDVESLFWILMYFLLFMHPENDKITADDAQKRLHKFHKIFVYSTGINGATTARAEFLKGNATVEMEIIETVPEPFTAALACAVFLATELRQEYVRIEALLGSTNDPYSAELYASLQTYLDEALTSEEAGRLGQVVELTARASARLQTNETARAKSSIGEKRKGEAIAGGLSTKERKRSRQG
ncbi:hypothetical protein WG66_008975 [Moniliophthora roreri]|nr:hypothetical protein WG66_008975 [Moniliophthora roreri]